MRYFWLAIMVVTLVPAAVASLLFNPLVFLLLGPEAWREQVARVYPYRWWLATSLVALALATTMFTRSYA